VWADAQLGIVDYGIKQAKYFMDLHNLPPTDIMQPGDSPLHAENRSGQGNLRKSDKGGKEKKSAEAGRRITDAALFRVGEPGGHSKRGRG
jgi:hypothetical protein